MRPWVVAPGHLLMDDAAAGRHPLDVSRGDYPPVAHAVAVFHFPRQDIGDGFDPPVRMPGEALAIVGGIIGAKIVQEEKGVELGHLVVAEGPSQADPRPLQGGLALPDFVDFSDFGS